VVSSLNTWQRSCPELFYVLGEIPQGALLMKLRTICAVATIFMAFFTVAVWKSPMRGEY
jgi:hypothetical protein